MNAFGNYNMSKPGNNYHYEISGKESQMQIYDLNCIWSTIQVNISFRIRKQSSDSKTLGKSRRFWQRETKIYLDKRRILGYKLHVMSTVDGMLYTSKLVKG